MPEDAAIILFAHGARDPEWAAPFRAIREQIKAARPDTPVEVAFLELMQPNLDVAVDRLAADGARRIMLVPLFMARGGHLKQDLARLLAEIGQKHPRLELKVTPAIGESPEILQAISDWVLRAAG
jgi:sirohydrochlorin cobaltochelatase